MHKVALFQSISRQYLSAKHSIRRHRKAISMIKLVLVSCICLGIFTMYAVNVSASSTAGWKLKEVQRELKDKEFDYSIAKLDVLQLEGKLFDQRSQNANYWYDNEGSLVVVNAFNEGALK